MGISRGGIIAQKIGRGLYLAEVISYASYEEFSPL
jgi:hypothetical protein